MTLEKELTYLGLKVNEIRVYLAVLELGEPTVGFIERQTGLHKQLIYNAASSLQEKGLISIHEIRGRKRFSVSNPAALEEHARARLEKAQELVPQLFDRANKKRAADKVRTYREVRGVQQYYLESIRRQPEKSEVFILGVNSERYFEVFAKDSIAYQRFENTRIDRAIKFNLLLFGAENIEIELNKHRPALDLRLLEGAIQGPMDIMIWHDHVGMLFYGDEPYVLDIVGQQIVLGYKEYFSILWKQAKKT
jgi:sugar-specific transcriptional regulator TrmB